MVNVRDLGTIEYGEAEELQRTLHQQLVAGAIGDTVLLCSHLPVVTCGTSTEPLHLLLSAEEFDRRGIAVHTVDRGGSVTYHGPEQVVCYPLLDLRRHKRDVGWYMRSLEEVILRTLAEFGVLGVRIAGKAGVWLPPTAGATESNSKIAFAGVRISRWCTRHGFSLNVLRCSDRFEGINPCGLGSIRVVSLEEVASRPVTVSAVREAVVSHLCEVFQVTIHPGV